MRSSTSRPRRPSRPATGRCRSSRRALRSRTSSRSSSIAAAKARAPGGEGEPRLPQQRRSNSLGSGFVIDPSGIVVTNNHVIGDANDISVIFSDGTRLKAGDRRQGLEGRPRGAEGEVRQAAQGGPVRRLGGLRPGDWVMAIGNPFGLGGSVTAGIVSARGRNIESGPYDNYIQTDASINKGNSGGPLFNMKGEVIGINTAILSPTGGSVGIGFAVPASTALPVIDQLRQFGETRRGWLGVRIQNVDEPPPRRSPRRRPRRLGRRHRRQGSGQARRARGRRRDRPLRRPRGEGFRDLPRIVASTPVGKAVDVMIVRKGKEETKQVTLGPPRGRRAPAARPPSSSRRPTPRPPPGRPSASRSRASPRSCAGAIASRTLKGRRRHSRRPDSRRRRQAHPARRRDRRGRPGAGRPPPT